MTLFDDKTVLEDLWRAYYDARKHKRNTANAILFELRLEHNIHQLYLEIVENRYVISPSICFIVYKPVKREIFAANFRDRVVHHYVMNKLMCVFENQFIDDTYSCRVGKGTLFGVRRLQSFIRRCSENYQKDAYILKLDIQGYFMNIFKPLLYQKMEKLIRKKYRGNDLERLLGLVKCIVLNDPTENCIVKGRKKDWDGLPTNKSLFTTPKDCGLPIGNLTSQIFANYYLSDFDRFMKEKLKLKYYGRYVDDFFIVHQDRKYLKSLVPIINDYLYDTLGARVHPKKVYLQSCVKGVNYLGAYVLPYRAYLSKRTKGNFYEAVSKLENYGTACLNSPFKEENKLIEAGLNAYFGPCMHTCSYKFCNQMLDVFSDCWFQQYEIASSCHKVHWRGKTDVEGFLFEFGSIPFQQEDILSVIVNVHPSA